MLASCAHLRAASRRPARWRATRRAGCAYSTLEIRGDHFGMDSWTNITPSVLARVCARSPLTDPRHPLATLKSRIEKALPDFAALTTPTPAVSVAKNFDQLGFPPDHPGRARTDSYYVNKDTVLQTHTSAHEVATFATGTPKWLLTADVYRRDEIDASHYPVFHQMEGARLFSSSAAAMRSLATENEAMSHQLASENLVTQDSTSISTSNPYQPRHDPVSAALVTANLKHTLNKLIVDIFAPEASASEPLRVRWIEAYFPFTSPSYEVEVFYRGKWLEILGCGVVNQRTLDHAERNGEVAWAFGLGLERICMPLFGIPDIRLFWSQDERFLSQFESGRVSRFKPYSKYPSNWKDISFWQQSDPIHDNDVCDVIRDVAGDLVEDVACIDRYADVKSGRTSLCYRVHFRSMDRSLSNAEVSQLREQIEDRLLQKMDIVIRM